jgi:hypothetical protein
MCDLALTFTRPGSLMSFGCLLSVSAMPEPRVERETAAGGDDLANERASIAARIAFEGDRGDDLVCFPRRPIQTSPGFRLEAHTNSVFPNGPNS